MLCMLDVHDCSRETMHTHLQALRYDYGALLVYVMLGIAF